MTDILGGTPASSTSRLMSPLSHFVKSSPFSGSPFPDPPFRIPLCRIPLCGRVRVNFPLSASDKNTPAERRTRRIYTHLYLYLYLYHTYIPIPIPIHIPIHIYIYIYIYITIIFQSTESGAGEQFLLWDCRAKAAAKGVFLHRHRYKIRCRNVSSHDLRQGG